MNYKIKGGAWTNLEDEILKTAVMKYCLNQWSRVSSLVKKPAKECKARWYEWLDPSIRKTEWTKEEEEKLLHLAKAFPCQWRTIAPIVGKTPAQCVEYYEKLLNQAQGKVQEDENDPRKLKPGEIDPNPETRAARPDPIDMEDEDKELIAEARVRLANVMTKKKSRKLRERKIEEARRLADIQKRRELRAAGIEVNSKKKIRGVDYNQEVPFEKAPFQLEYTTGPEENPKANLLHLANITLQTLEGKRRDDEEQQRRKVDEKVMKKLKKRDLPRAVTHIKQLKNAYTGIKTELILPSPQIHDKELEKMGKMESQGGFEVTKFLGGNYTSQAGTNTFRDTLRHNSLRINACSEIRKQIKSSLLLLPKPKNEYQIEMIEIHTLTQTHKQKKKLDAEEQDALDRKLEKERLERKTRFISQSVRKNLPRPYKPSRRLIDSYLSRVPEEAELRKEAEILLAEEMLKMNATDIVLFPFEGSFPGEDIAEQGGFTEKDLLEADRVLKEEMLAVKKLLRHEELSKESFITLWEEARKNVVFDDDKQMFVDGQRLSREERIYCAINEFQEKKDRLEKEEKNIEDLQKKAGVSLEIYPRREKQIQQKLTVNLQNAEKFVTEKEVLKQLRLQEQRASFIRIGELKKFCEHLNKKEAELQKKHEKLLKEREEAEREAPVIQLI